MQYHWSHADSLIRDIEFKPVGKHTEALIYAPAGAEKERLSEVAASLRSAGFAVVPDVKDDRQLLRVEKLEDKALMLNVLEHHGTIKGAPTLQATEADKKPHESFSQKFRKHTVETAGYGYLLADALMIASGLLRMKGLWKNPEELKGGMNEMGTGLIWATANSGLVFYGKKNPDVQLGVAMRGLKSYLAEQGIDVPREDQEFLAQLARPETVVNRAEEFAYNHPTQINNSIEALGGLKLLNAGRTQTIGFDKKPNYYKMAQGALVFGGMGGSVVLPEKSAAVLAEEAKEKHQGEGFLSHQIHWFAQKPLRVAGWGAGINNVFGLIGPAVYERPAIKAFMQSSAQGVEGKTSAQVALQRQKAQNYLGASGLNIGTSVAFLMANGMYSMGSKDTGVDLKSSGALDQLYAVTAHVIASHPKAQQSGLINQLAGYFSAKEDIKDSAADIALALRTRVEGLSQSPWAQRVQAPSSAEAPQRSF